MVAGGVADRSRGHPQVHGSQHGGMLLGQRATSVYERAIMSFVFTPLSCIWSILFPIGTEHDSAK